MNDRVLIRPTAQDEIDEHTAYIDHDNPTAATRFLGALADTLEQLIEMPRMGSLRRSPFVRLHDVRCVPVIGFPKYMVFYRPSGKGIVVMHLLHSSRDVGAIFARDEA